MTLEQRIDKARTYLSRLLHAASCSLGTDRLADTDRFPTETDWRCRKCGSSEHSYLSCMELDEPMTTLWEWEDEQRKLKGPKE